MNSSIMLKMLRQNELGSNPLGTEPSVVLKRYTSDALAFQGSCMTIDKLSNIFNKYLSVMI